MLTFGTGIGSTLLHDGRHVPNTELGQPVIDGRTGQRLAAAALRATSGLTWEEWAVTVNRYLTAVEEVLWPDLLVIGGGISENAERWLPLLATHLTRARGAAQQGGHRRCGGRRRGTPPT